jgi:hypothetical protein
MAETTPAPWERQPGESARAFGAFGAYRDLGARRSLRAAAETFYGRRSAALERQVDRWSRAFAWVERAAAWDRHLDAEACKAQEKARRDMAERHVKEAQTLQAKALERLRALRPEELGPTEVLRFLVEAAKLERLALGEPETVSEQRFGPVVLQIVEEVVGRPAPASSATHSEEVLNHDSDTTSSDNPDGADAPGPAGLPAE